MPQAIAHILVPIIIISLIRDFYIKKSLQVSRTSKKERKSFSLHYVLIAGIGGIIPDLDIALFWIMYFFGFAFEQIHKTFLHSFFIPIAFFVLFLALKKVEYKRLEKYHLKINIIFLMLAIGSLTHLILDIVFGSISNPLFPMNISPIGLSLIHYLPKALQGLAMPSLDALLFVLWVAYLEIKHKISDFI